MAWLDVGWGVFAIANLVAMQLIPTWETVPFHFIWVSITILYGFRVWPSGPTIVVLAGVMTATGVGIYVDYERGTQPLDELTEVPLMAAMFAAMVWHARRRLAATRQIERVSESNRRLIERQHDFIQDASHELRTPITVALGHAELILREAAGTLRDDATVVVDELTRLRRLSDRLLLLATAEDADFLDRAAVEVEDILVDTMRRWAPIPRRWQLGTIVDATVLADRDRLALAIDALVENAVKHTTASQVIELSARRDAGMVAIAVTDGGEGLGTEDLDRLFERFKRGGGSAGEGSGLGLAIVKAIVAAHGGRPRARRRPEGGSTFELLLPEARRSLEQGDGWSAAPASSGALPSR
ncbi:MAG TPA: HAMP domain-containing sensor histidine kinase [Candidatus Dormibacteraeota bacterium]